MREFLLAFIMLVTVLGPAVVIGMIGSSSIQALGRNPSASPKIMLAMITALVFVEAIAVLALLLVLPIIEKV